MGASIALAGEGLHAQSPQMTSDPNVEPQLAALIAVQLPDADEAVFRASIAEMHRLARTLGITVAATITQKRRTLHAGTVIGSGKLKELQAVTGTGEAGATAEGEGEGDEGDGAGDQHDADDVDDAGDESDQHDPLSSDARRRAAADQEDAAPTRGGARAGAPGGMTANPRLGAGWLAAVAVAHGGRGQPEGAGPADGSGAAGGLGQPIALVLVDHDLTPSQARNLERATGAEVLDRTAVILEIFRRHARSRMAKAQVEIVRLQYLVPRLREAGKGRDRQRGGIGGKGAGESSLELDRRKIRDRIAELTREIHALAEEQGTQRARRRDMNRVALVGYTNAGKSTLMRALTGSEVYVADKLFATLETTVRALAPEVRPRILVSDTVGFIDKLPHGLVASFKSTLDEALEAGLLAHVVDASDPNFERQLSVTAEVLEEIGAGDVPRLLIFNKMDRVGDAAAEEASRARLQARWPEAVILSARRPADIVRLRERLITFFSRDLVSGEVRVPYSRQNLRGEIFAQCEVLSERYEEDVVIFDVRAHPAVIERLRAA
jgi:GTP-binding protein HflX